MRNIFKVISFFLCAFFDFEHFGKNYGLTQLIYHSGETNITKTVPDNDVWAFALHSRCDRHAYLALIKVRSQRQPTDDPLDYSPFFYKSMIFVTRRIRHALPFTNLQFCHLSIFLAFLRILEAQCLSFFKQMHLL